MKTPNNWKWADAEVENPLALLPCLISFENTVVKFLSQGSTEDALAIARESGYDDDNFDLVCLAMSSDLSSLKELISKKLNEIKTI